MAAICGDDFIATIVAQGGDKNNEKDHSINNPPLESSVICARQFRTFSGWLRPIRMPVKNSVEPVQWMLHNGSGYGGFQHSAKPDTSEPNLSNSREQDD